MPGSPTTSFDRSEAASGGLTAREAAERLRTSGPNELPQALGVHPVVRFLAQFNNALIYFLIAAAVATALLGQFVDTTVIVAVVIVNAIVGFVQEGKAEKSLDAIRTTRKGNEPCPPSRRIPSNVLGYAKPPYHAGTTRAAPEAEDPKGSTPFAGKKPMPRS
jgi:magnesium-transporting ATPase (P-type)